MTSPDLSALEAKALVPARDFELSRRFYQAVGFTLAWSTDDLAEMRHGQAAFLLQRFFVEPHARNFQMHLLVASADDWHDHLTRQGIAGTFSVGIGEPGDRPWGLRDFTLEDPSGVVWRIGHVIAP